MKNILTIDKAIELLGENREERRSLADIRSNIRVIDKNKSQLISGINDAFKTIMTSYEEVGISIDGMCLSPEELENSLKKLQERFAETEQKFEEAHREYSQYNDVNFEPQLNTIERNRILAEKKVAWDENKKAKEALWQEINNLQETINKAREGEISKYTWLSEMYATKKDELYDRLKDVENDKLRIVIKNNLEMIDEFLECIKGKEPARAEELARMGKVASALGIELVYEEGLEAPVVEKTKEIENPVVEEIQETAVSDLIEPQDIYKEFDGVTRYAESFDRMAEPEVAPVVEEPIVETPGERLKVNKSSIAIIDDYVKAALEEKGILSEADKLGSYEVVDDIRPGINNLYEKEIGNSQNRISKIEENVNKPLSKESTKELIEGSKEEIKGYSSYKREAAERKTSMAQPLDSEVDDFQKSFEESMKELGAQNVTGKTIDEILDKGRGL